MQAAKPSVAGGTGIEGWWAGGAASAREADAGVGVPAAHGPPRAVLSPSERLRVYLFIHSSP